MTTLTSGAWRAGSIARSTADWPFDWLCEITSFDPLTRSYRYVATVRQSGARAFAEALANVAAMTRAPKMLELLRQVDHVIDMSDPEHPRFADSAADCLDALLRFAVPLREILAELAPAAPARSPTIAGPGETRYLVVVVKDQGSGLLFWNQETGFGPLKSASVFTEHEANALRLPYCASGPPGWLELPLLPTLSGAGV